MSHASFSGQSVADWQPHVPVLAVHAAPASAATQFLQTVSAAPQAVGDWLGAHAPALQQVPLQASEAEQVAEQAWVVRLQACPTGHPLGPEHPASVASTPASAGPASSTFPSGVVTSAPESLASGC